MADTDFRTSLRRTVPSRAARLRASSSWTPRSDLVPRPRPQGGHRHRARRARLRGAVADPGEGDPGIARRLRHDRPGADRHRQDRGLRVAAAAVPGPQRRRDPGDRPHPDPRALHPGDAGAALLRRAPRRQRRRRVRGNVGPRAGVARPQQGARRRRHRRADEGPDLPRRARPDRHALRRPRRGRRDARSRVHRGRRADPAHVPERSPDDALQRDDAAADRPARRDLHVRPGDDLDHARRS